MRTSTFAATRFSALRRSASPRHELKAAARARERRRDATRRPRRARRAEAAVRSRQPRKPAHSLRRSHRETTCTSFPKVTSEHAARSQPWKHAPASCRSLRRRAWAARTARRDPAAASARQASNAERCSARKRERRALSSRTSAQRRAATRFRHAATDPRSVRCLWRRRHPSSESVTALERASERQAESARHRARISRWFASVSRSVSTSVFDLQSNRAITFHFISLHSDWLQSELSGYGVD